MDRTPLNFETAIESDGLKFISAAALRDFNSAQTDYLRFKSIYDDLIRSNYLPYDKNSKPEKYIKNVEDSVSLQLKGDTAFSEKNYDEAITLYTRSIATAPYPVCAADDSTELAIAFGVRSEAYVKMEKYKAALKDIEQALFFDYPDYMKYTLLIRQFECFLELNKLEEAEDSLNKASSFISVSVEPKEKCYFCLKANKFLLCIACYKSVVDRQIDGSNKASNSKKESSQKLTLKKTYTEHKKIPAASKCLKIKYSPTEYGRHLISTRDIYPGDILVIEEPYVAMIHQEYYNTHCSNCLKRSDALIPCKHCIMVKFCSEDCRNTAWTAFHDIECPILPFLDEYEVGHVPLLALRVLITATKTIADSNLQVLLEKIEFLEEHNMFFGAETGYNKNNQYLSSSYIATHMLCRNSIHRIYKSGSLNITYYLVAALVVNCLDQYSQFFLPPITQLASPNSDPDLDWQIFIGSLYTQYASIVTTNGILISEHQYNRSTNQAHVINYGNGVYNTLSLLNHSCFHNVQSFSSGKTQVLYATRPIKSGEQLFINYGYFYQTQNLEERRAELVYHFFTCKCEACVNNWPTEQELETRLSTYICSACKNPMSAKPSERIISCTKCKAPKNVALLSIKIYDIMCRIDEIYDRMFTPSGLEEDYTKELSEYLTLVVDNFQMPNLSMLTLQDALSENMRRKGNHYQY